MLQTCYRTCYRRVMERVTCFLFLKTHTKNIQLFLLVNRKGIYILWDKGLEFKLKFPCFDLVSTYHFMKNTIFPLHSRFDLPSDRGKYIYRSVPRSEICMEITASRGPMLH